MAEPLYELLLPELEGLSTPPPQSPGTLAFLTRLSTLSLASLTTTEPDALSYDLQSSQRSIQALSKRSYKSVNDAADSLLNLQDSLPQVTRSAKQLQDAIPSLEESGSRFVQKYDRARANDVLDRRKRSMRLGENAEQISDMLALPSLLSSTIASASSSSSSASAGTSVQSSNASYASALDLHGYIKRLNRLYPESKLIKSISLQADDAMRDMTTNLIVSLRSPSLKLAGAMRLIGLLRRVAPELEDQSDRTTGWTTAASEGSAGALFLVCRLVNLTSNLEALEPLRDLADQENIARINEPAKENTKWSGGHQTERYLKRYVEIFREQTFAMVSMYKSIFPASLPEPPADKSTVKDESLPSPNMNGEQKPAHGQNTSHRLPSALSTLTPHLVEMLMETLKKYLPHVQDRSARDSLLVQVLYCANSLGRLGGDFGMALALLEEDMAELDASDGADGREGDTESAGPEWVDIMKKHRVQASRLELLASGAGPLKSPASPSRDVSSTA